MQFKVQDKTNWARGNEWESFFTLINDFKKEFGLTVGSISGKENQYCFRVDKYSIYFDVTSQGFFISLEADTDKEDFDDKFNFIFSRLGKWTI